MFVKDKVSIVTPVYNGEKYLSLMLDSVLEQTYSEIEMILVDDGSEDLTVRVAENYREKFAARGYGYRIVRAEHKCAAAAINRGLSFVTGEYLIWPDSDDRLERCSVEKRVRFLERYPEYQCVRTLPYYFKQGTGEPMQADENLENYSNEELFWDLLEYRSFVCCGCYMLRTEPFFSIYPERCIPEYHVGQNFQMLLPFMFLHRCPTIPEKLYGVCVRENSHSRVKLTRGEEEERYQEYEDLIDEIADICHIEDEASKERIAQWKIRRRYFLAVKYRCVWELIRACRGLHPCKGLSIYKMVKDFLWVVLEDTWVIKSLYPLYRDLIGRCEKIPGSDRAGEIVRAVRCKANQMSLTFDDGYEYTPEILEKLEQYHIKATFFLTGDWMEKNPELCRRISEAGHEIGNHGYSHCDMTLLPEKEAREEIGRGQQLIKKATGKRCVLFRFPYGTCNEELLELVKKQGLRAVRWSISSSDWTGIDAEEICRNVMESKNLKKGAIVLLHTTHSQTIEALDLLIPALHKKGYQLVTVSDLLFDAPKGGG